MLHLQTESVCRKYYLQHGFGDPVVLKEGVLCAVLHRQVKEYTRARIELVTTSGRVSKGFVVSYIFIRNQNYWWCICSLTLPLGIYIWFAWEMQWPHALLLGLSGTGSSAGRSHCVLFLTKTIYSKGLTLRVHMKPISHRLVSRNWVLASKFLISSSHFGY